jgi:eukaryotic-like serine/threonine-protein kinase
MKNVLFRFRKIAQKCLFTGAGILASLAPSFTQSNMFDVTPDHSGMYNSIFPSDLILTKKWSVKTKGRIFSSASVQNGVAYFGSEDSCMYAVESDGTMKWKFKSNGKIRSTPAIKDTILYFNNFGGKFYALDTRTGAEIWSSTIDVDSFNAAKGINSCTPHDKVLIDPWDSYQSSPLYLDTIVYFGSGKKMYAMNLKTGQQLWNYTLPRIVHSTPAISNGILYFGCWDSKLYALDALTGSKIWDFQAGMDTVYNYMAGVQSSPSVVDSFVFIGSRDANVYALNAKTGKKLWATGFNGSWMPSSFAVNQDTLYTGSSDAAGFFALNKKTGKVNYSVKLPCFAFSTPAYSNGTIFIGSLNGCLYSIDTKTRKINSRFSTLGHTRDILHALNDDGSLNEKVFPTGSDYDSSVLWTEILMSTGSIFSSPVVENNVVYFGSTDSCFYAVQDNGACKPKFTATTDELNFTQAAGNLVDTTFQINFSSDCTDTIVITKSGSTTFNNALTIDPSEIIPDSSKTSTIKIAIDLTLIKSSVYSGKLILYTKSNEYNAETINVSIQKTTSTTQITNSLNTLFAYPNPFTDFSVIEYALKTNSRVEAAIFSINGQTIKTLYNSNQVAGNQKIIWDGTNNSGQKVMPGMYICIIRENNNCSRLVVVKGI